MIQFDLDTENAETVPEVPKSEEIQTGTPLAPVKDFPVLDLDAAKLAFEPFLEKVNEMFRQAEAIVVNNETTKAEATTLGTSAMSLYEKLENARKDLVAEPNQYVKSINSLAHALTDKLYIEKKKGDKNKDEVQTIVSIAKQKITHFNAIEEQKRRDDEERLRKATEEAQARLDEEAKTKGFMSVQLPKAVIPKKSTVTRTESGSSHSVRYWDFEVIEPFYIRQLAADLKIQWNKMLDQVGNVAVKPETVELFIASIDQLLRVAPYLVWSDTLLREAVRKGGIREIPSVKIWERDDTTFRK